jgi:hypothetical protein
MEEMDKLLNGINQKASNCTNLNDKIEDENIILD